MANNKITILFIRVSLLFVMLVGYASSFVQAQDQQTVPKENTEQATPQDKNKNKNKNKKKVAEKTLLIEVTSNKRKENIQDVPASVSAFSSTELEDRRVETVADTAALVPNYFVADWGNGGTSFHAIRGQSNIAQASVPLASMWMMSHFPYLLFGAVLTPTFLTLNESKCCVVLREICTVPTLPQGL